MYLSKLMDLTNTCSGLNYKKNVKLEPGLFL